MIIIIGLGNPGEKYENTRHNAGFLFLDKLAEKNNFDEFRYSRKFNSDISEGLINDQKIVLVKPQTFMNESGRAVEAIKDYYKVDSPSGIIVIHDEIDVPLGKIKIVKDRGSAGHKGVKSIIEKLGNDFIRFRIGIGAEDAKTKDTEKFVIEEFSKKEQAALKHSFKKALQALEDLLVDGIEKTMSKYNQ